MAISIQALRISGLRNNGSSFERFLPAIESFSAMSVCDLFHSREAFVQGAGGLFQPQSPHCFLTCQQ